MPMHVGRSNIPFGTLAAFGCATLMINACPLHALNVLMFSNFDKNALSTMLERLRRVTTHVLTNNLITIGAFTCTAR